MRTLCRMCMISFLFCAANVFAQDDAAFRKFCDDMNDKFNNAMVSGDYNAIASMYTDDAISLQSYSPMWVGKDAITEGNKKTFTDQGMKFSNPSSKTVQVIGNGDTRIEIGTFQVTVTSPNMPQAMTDHGKYMNVWQKQSDGSWKIKADTWNSDMNPYTTMAGAKPKEDNSK